MAPITANALFYGDNLYILREYVDDESIDQPPSSITFKQAARLAAQDAAQGELWRPG